MTKQNPIQARSVIPCLTFQDRAEEAVSYCVSTFKDSKVLEIVRSTSGGPVPKGKLLHATFELNGQKYTAFDGGPHFKFSEAISLVVTCDTQAELDAIWARLSNEGKEGPCGWLTDKFGVSWQIVPTSLGAMMSNPKDGNPANVMNALMKMRKLDIKALEKAYRS